MIPGEVRVWCQQNGFGSIASSRPVGGGCINNGMLLVTESGKRLFLKTNSRVPEDMFEREAEGLRALVVDGGPRVPDVYLHHPNFLLLEDLESARRSEDYWEIFGRQLAVLHNQTTMRFGFVQDNYIGSTSQPNPWTEDGYTFFAESRLLHQAFLANRRGLLPAADLRRVERLASRLPELIPQQPASLLHGDLWSGNAVTDSTGLPALIDPAAHYGWAEAELGMTRLFGGFGKPFYDAYLEARPCQPGIWERLSIYNLYHLLNHLNIFGSGYLHQTVSILDRYAT